MNVLQVANGFPPGARAGVEQYTLHLSRRLLKSGHQVRVFCREHAPRLADYTVLDDTWEDVPVRRVVNNLADVVRVEDYYQNARIEGLFVDMVREARPDLIHFQHVIGLSVTLLAAAQRLGIPFLLTLHDYWFICPTVHLLTTEMQLCAGPHHGADCRQCVGLLDGVTHRLHSVRWYRELKASVPESIWNPAQRLVRRAIAGVPRPGRGRGGGPAVPSPYTLRSEAMQAALAQCPQLVTPSAFVRDVYADFGVPAERIRVVPLGLDLAHWQAQAEPDPAGRALPAKRFVYIGTLWQHKGVDILIRAFRALPHRDARLAIYGSGFEDDPYQETIRRLARGDARIQFMGAYDNRALPALLAAADALVIPSRWHETFSIVAREGLLAGIPIIASQVGAIPEVIHDGENGLLVPPGDVAALAGALRKLADPATHLAAAHGSSRPYVRSIEDHAAEIEGLYRQIVAGQAEVAPAVRAAGSSGGSGT